MTLETKEPEIDETRVKYYEYVCTECHATDTLKLFPNEPIPPCANCWNCRTGRQFQSSMEQVNAQIGMFVKREVPYEEYKSPFEKSLSSNVVTN